MCWHLEGRTFTPTCWVRVRNSYVKPKWGLEVNCLREVGPGGQNPTNTLHLPQQRERAWRELLGPFLHPKKPTGEPQQCEQMGASHSWSCVELEEFWDRVGWTLGEVPSHRIPRNPWKMEPA